MSKTIKIVLIVLGVTLLIGAGIVSTLMYTSQNLKYDSIAGFTSDFNEAGYGVAEESISEDMFDNSSNEKLVYSGDVSISVEKLDESYSQAQELMKTHNAFIENLSQYETSIYLTIRIPKNDFLNFYNALSSISGTITDSNISVENYTKYYRDNERRIDILKTEYDELKELMQEADNVEDILAIKDRLSYLTYDLENLTSQNNEIDYDVDYATLNLRLRKIGNNIIEDTPFGIQLKDAFKNSIKIFKNLILGLVNIWWVVVIPVAIFVVYKRKKKREIK